MSEYLDKTGLSYFWGKIKGKLNNKADNDKYKIATFTEKYKHPSASGSLKNIISEKDIKLDKPNSNDFIEPFPSGYHIACVLATDWYYYKNQQAYEEDTSWSLEGVPICQIMPIQMSVPDGKYQRVRVYIKEEIEPYGIGRSYTLLLEKN